MREERQKVSAQGRGWHQLGRLDFTYVILACCVLVAISFLASLRRENAALASEVGRLSKELREHAAQAGDIVQPFAAVDLEGNRVAMELPADRKQLLYIFSTGCHACATQRPVWDSLAQHIQSDRLAVRGISLDSLDTTRAYFKDSPPSYPVVIAQDSRFSRMYRVDRIPQVMLISGLGTVEWTHAGALTEDALAELTAKVK